MVGPIKMPDSGISPLVSLLRRLALALGALVATALIVYFGRDGYLDNNSDTPISLADAFYYATVSVSTTGYGDIVPVSDQARLITTIFSLAAADLPGPSSGPRWALTESSGSLPIQRWRPVRNHNRSRRLRHKAGAVETLLADGPSRPPSWGTRLPGWTPRPPWAVR